MNERRRPTPIKAPTQLLVEGNDQRNFFEAFAAHLGLHDVQVRNFGGVDEPRAFLETLRAGPVPA